MTLFKIGQIENNSFTCWYTGDTMNGMREFLQYMLDSLNNPKTFYIVNVKNNTMYNAHDIAINFFKLKKRTLAEKLEG